MTDKKVWFFIKFFSEEAHADQFIKGSLYLNRLSYFRKAENHVDDGRLDVTEAVVAWWQKDEIKINLNVPGVGDVEITKDDLAAPVSISLDYHDHFHIFCLYAVYTEGFAVIEGKFDLTEDQVAELQRQITIDEKCFKFGKFAVVIHAVPFKAQLKEVLQRRGQWYRGAFVEYYDDETFHGRIPEAEAPFRKQKRFSHEKEYRICLQTNTKGDDPVTIEIGDIGSIAAKIPSSCLADALQLKLEACPAAAAKSD